MTDKAPQLVTAPDYAAIVSRAISENPLANPYELLIVVMRSQFGFANPNVVKTEITRQFWRGNI